MTTPEATESTAPVMVRAAITGDEWRMFRMLAVGMGVPVQVLVGDAIRRTLKEQEDQQS